MRIGRSVYVRFHGASGRYDGSYPDDRLATGRPGCTASGRAALTCSHTSTTTSAATRHETPLALRRLPGARDVDSDAEATG